MLYKHTHNVHTVCTSFCGLLKLPLHLLHQLIVFLLHFQHTGWPEDITGAGALQISLAKMSSHTTSAYSLQNVEGVIISQHDVTLVENDMNLSLCTALFEGGGKLGKDNATKYGANREDKEPMDGHS